MADNDYAVGLLVEKVAQQPVQGQHPGLRDRGRRPERRRPRRSRTARIAYVAGPYVKQGAVVSKHYTTVSMLRTIEDVLGLRAAGPVRRPGRADGRGVRPQPEQLGLRGAGAGGAVHHPAAAAARGRRPRWRPAGPGRRTAQYWAAAMAGQDFASEDRLDEPRFNRALWAGLKGDQVPFPTHRHGRDLRSTGPSSCGGTPRSRPAPSWRSRSPERPSSQTLPRSCPFAVVLLQLSFFRTLTTRPLIVVALAAVAGVVGAYLSSRLALRTSFAQLLPADDPGVRALQQTQARMGDLTLLLVGIRSPDSGRQRAIRRGADQPPARAAPLGGGDRHLPRARHLRLREAQPLALRQPGGPGGAARSGAPGGPAAQEPAADRPAGRGGRPGAGAAAPAQLGPWRGDSRGACSATRAARPCGWWPCPRAGCSSRTPARPCSRPPGASSATATRGGSTP